MKQTTIDKLKRLNSRAAKISSIIISFALIGGVIAIFIRVAIFDPLFAVFFIIFWIVMWAWTFGDN